MMEFLVLSQLALWMLIAYALSK